MTENQILALISSVLVLILVLRGRAGSISREGLLPKIAIWLAIFAAVGLAYKFFGPG